jgi:predicted transcriptional regulator
MNENNLTMVTAIAAAYVSNNHVTVADLPQLLTTISGAVAGMLNPTAPVAEAPRVPAVSIKKSVTPDFLICLEDGQKFKSLKRHLRSKYNMSPEEYRAKWGLPKDYPMVAPSYAQRRSELAKSTGLGKLGQGANHKDSTPAPVTDATKAPKAKAAKAPKAPTAAKAPKAPKAKSTAAAPEATAA